MAWETTFNLQMLELSLSEEDVEELRSERSIKQTRVTNEEIEELSIDESLSPLERTVYILSSGQDIQKLSAIENIHNLIISQPENREKIFALFSHILTSADDQIQQATAKSLLNVLEDGLIEATFFTTACLPNILNNLQNAKVQDVCQSWVETLVASFKLISKETVVTQVLPFLTSNGTLTQCYQTRRICCKIVSHLVDFVDEQKLLNCVIPQMKALCQDIELDIRSYMSYELESMFHKVSVDVAGKYILPELCLLLQDEEMLVRRAALSTITTLIPDLSKDLLSSSSLVTLIENFYRKSLAKKATVDLITAAKFIGKIVYFLSESLCESDWTFYLDCFQVLSCQNNKDGMLVNSQVPSNDPSAECRYWCAYNFPAMLVSFPVDSFSQNLLPSFLYLIKDKHPMVRRTMACSLHEVSRILSSEVHLILNGIKACIKDTDAEVVDGVLSGLPSTLECLHKESPKHQASLILSETTAKRNFVADLIPSLLLCEQTLFSSLQWRTYQRFITNISCLHQFVYMETILNKFVPLLQKILISNKVLPVKLEAARTLLTYAKHNQKFEERRDICNRLITDLAHSTNSRHRMLFLDICYSVTDLFSKNFFKCNFHDVVMEMAVIDSPAGTLWSNDVVVTLSDLRLTCLLGEDPIVNVRMKFCTVLPLLKSQIRLPIDRLLLQMLEQTVRRIMALENNADVCDSIRMAILKLDNVRMSMDGTPQTSEDVEDMEREKLEMIIFEEYQHRKEHETIANRNRSYSLADKGDHLRKNRLLSKDQVKKVAAKSSGPLSVVLSAKKSGQSKSKESCTARSSGAKLTSKKSSVSKAGKSGVNK